MFKGSKKYAEHHGSQTPTADHVTYLPESVYLTTPFQHYNNQPQQFTNDSPFYVKTVSDVASQKAAQDANNSDKATHLKQATMNNVVHDLHEFLNKTMTHDYLANKSAYMPKLQQILRNKSASNNNNNNKNNQQTNNPLPMSPQSAM